VNPTENINFRANLHEYLTDATKYARNDFVELCRAKPAIVFKTMFWTFQPRPEIKPAGILPFITWDWQDEKIDELAYLMLHGGKVQIKKSREVGGTWIILGTGLAIWLFTPNIVGLVCSRKEDLVDRKGDPDCLYWKLDFMLKNMPEWSRPDFVRTDRHLHNKWNDSVIDGESTNLDVGRGGRRTWSFCDEFPSVPLLEAQSIERALSDTASCKIYLGTSIYRSHPFSKMGTMPNVKKMALGWWLHPFKKRGIYYSPDMNKIVIDDIQYYRDIAPKVFDKYENGEQIKYSDLQTELFLEYPEVQISFVANGGDVNRPKWRSPWYDEQCLERDSIDIATNLDMNEIGSGDMVFSVAALNQMTDEYAREPLYTGEVLYGLREDKISNVRFVDGGRGKLKWWSDFGGVRPVQNHNYVFGCDISLGQGRSNSVCTVFDVDDRKKVGSWVSSNVLPESFAEQIYALGKWVGGLSGFPLLNFEANGIGQVFSKRIKELGYPFMFKTTSEKKGYHEKKQTIGWYSNSNTKIELLAGYNAAMSACFSGSSHKMFINPDEESIREAEDYVFHGTQAIPSSSIEDSGGAKATHGDRVIADALACLAAGDQRKAAKEFSENIVGSFEWRKKKIEQRRRDIKQRPKIWLNL
jgi:hypothetical protein